MMFTRKKRDPEINRGNSHHGVIWSTFALLTELLNLDHWIFIKTSQILAHFNPHITRVFRIQKNIFIQGESPKMAISSLMNAVFDLDSWNLVIKTKFTQGIRFCSQKLRFLNMTVHFRKIKNLKSIKNGSSKKSWKNKGSK